MEHSGLAEKLKQATEVTLHNLRSLWPAELAIDPGTENTRIFEVNKGVTLNEPSVIAFRPDGRMVAAGHRAKRMLGREPRSIRVIRPLRDGVIADYEAAEKMLRYFIHKASGRRPVISPRVLVCVSGQLSPVERRAWQDTFLRASARSVHFIAEPFAAATGAGLAVEGAQASMLVDIGAGTTDIAVLSLGGVIDTVTLRIGGMEMCRAIARYLHDEHEMKIGENTAETILHRLGSANGEYDEEQLEIEGYSLSTRLPVRKQINGAEISNAIEPVLHTIVHGVLDVLEDLRPEVAADLMNTGIVLTGGVAQLHGLPERISQQTGLAVPLAANPMLAVVMGAGRLLELPGQESGATLNFPAGLFPRQSQD